MVQILFLTLSAVNFVLAANEWQTFPLDSPNYKNYFDSDCRACGLVSGGTHCIDKVFSTSWCCNYQDIGQQNYCISRFTYCGKSTQSWGSAELNCPSYERCPGQRKYFNSRMNNPYRHFIAEDYDTQAKNCKMSFGSRDRLKGKNVLNVKKVANMTYDVMILPDPDKYGDPKESEILYHISQKGGTYESPSDWTIILNFQYLDGSSYFEAYSSVVSFDADLDDYALHQKNWLPSKVFEAYMKENKDKFEQEEGNIQERQKFEKEQKEQQKNQLSTEQIAKQLQKVAMARAAASRNKNGISNPNSEKAQLYLLIIGGSGIFMLLCLSFCVWICRKREERKIKMLEIKRQELEDEYGNQQVEMNGISPLQALFESKPEPKKVALEPFSQFKAEDDAIIEAKARGRRVKIVIE